MDGRTLLVCAEQGFGDTIQFLRYVNELRERGENVLFEAQSELCPLLNCSGMSNVIAAGAPLPPFDVHVPILQLPRLFHTTLDTIPARVPYLTADQRLVAHWREKLADIKALGLA